MKKRNVAPELTWNSIRFESAGYAGGGTSVSFQLSLSCSSS
jgi:hypothetical protein